MAKWQVTKDGVPTGAPIFDDGDLAIPGDDTFSQDKVKALVASLGDAADGFNYLGQSEPPTE